MISVTKSPTEPPCLGEWRATAELDGGSVTQEDWQIVSGDCKQSLREKLYEDQYGLCAYCQSRLAGTSQPSLAKPERGMLVEHWEARATSPERTLDWSNLLGVCPGWVAEDEESHCDRARADKSLHTCPILPTTDGLFTYHTDGTIHAAPPAESDIETLNLNAKRLVRNRRAVLTTLSNSLRKDFSRRNIRKLIEVAKGSASGVRREYCGAALYYLGRKERQLQ